MMCCTDLCVELHPPYHEPFVQLIRVRDNPPSRGQYTFNTITGDYVFSGQDNGVLQITWALTAEGLAEIKMAPHDKIASFNIFSGKFVSVGEMG